MSRKQDRQCFPVPHGGLSLSCSFNACTDIEIVQFEGVPEQRESRTAQEAGPSWFVSFIKFNSVTDIVF